MASHPEVPISPHRERWEKVDQLFQAALERKPEERSSFLRQSCSGDDGLLHEVMSLLSAQERAGSFMESVPPVMQGGLLSRSAPGLLTGHHVGPYELLSLLGSGGMGEVYRSRDTRLERFVAIKFLSPEYSFDERRLQYFEREARLTSALNHPNIVTIHDIGRSEFGPFIAMELIEGTTLRGMLSPGGLPLKRMLQIGAQIAEGLAKAHTAGVFHRDLKPENVMVTRDWLVKILDFGLAKLARPSDQALNEPNAALESKPGVILGTVGYMSPEQASALPVDFRSDQFSLGTILYEMLTGKPPFERATAVETLSAIIRDEPEPLAAAFPKMPPPCLWIIDRCLAKNPEQRYASTADLASDLRNLRDRLGDFSTSSSPMRKRAMPNKAWIAALVGAVVFVLLMVFWLANFQTPPPAVHALTFANGHPTSARFAQDDQSVIYGAGWVGQDRELYMTQAGNSVSRRLGLKHAGILAVSPSDELAIAYPCRMNWGDCMGTLAQVPLGSGEPREVLENVTSADWRNDGKTLVVAQFFDGIGRIVQLPGESVLYESSGWITDIRVSPDGKHIAFIDHPILGDISGSVSLLLPGKKARVLSDGWKVLHGLAWRPDSDEIWFTGSREGRGLAAQLFAVSRTGGDVRPVFSAPSGLWIDDISKDGSRVLMRRVVPRATIIGRAPSDSKERDLSLFDFSTVADLSSDGKTLLFYEWGAGVRGGHVAYLRDVDGSDARRLGEGKPLALSPTHQWALVRRQTLPPELVLLPTGSGQPKTLARGSITEFTDWAAWPDPEHIVFSASEPGQRPRTYIQDIDGGLPRPVTPEGVVGLLLSPDGRHIAAKDKHWQYYVYSVEGGAPRPLDGFLDYDVFLQWANDGTIILRDSNDQKLNIYKLDLKSGARKLWKDLPPPYPAGLVGIGHDPGEIRITPDSRSYAYTFWTGVGELYLIEGLK